ncbi:Endo-1 like protein [Verticillium longisporum]|nr:Endo-1 like protein [Verticillium longisporum]
MLKSLVVLLFTSLVAAFPTLDTDQIAALHKRQATPNSQGTHGGFFYYCGGNLIGGKGWNPGTDNRTIQISGNYQGVGNSYLAVYGWLENPQVEYYIIEYHGVFNPVYDAQILGTAICDGSVYDISRSTRVSSSGTKILQRYWSIRRNKRTGGTVQTRCHFDAWRSTGLTATDHGFQIVATEGYFSSGFAEMTVADAGAEE